MADENKNPLDELLGDLFPAGEVEEPKRPRRKRKKKEEDAPPPVGGVEAIPGDMKESLEKLMAEFIKAMSEPQDDRPCECQDCRSEEERWLFVQSPTKMILHPGGLLLRQRDQFINLPPDQVAKLVKILANFADGRNIEEGG